MDAVCCGLHRARAGFAGRTHSCLVRQGFRGRRPALRILLAGQLIAASYGSLLPVMTMTRT